MSSNLKEILNKVSKYLFNLLEKIKYYSALAIVKIAKLFGNKEAKARDSKLKEAADKSKTSNKNISGKIITKGKTKWAPIDSSKSIYVPANNNDNIPLSILASTSKLFIVLFIFAIAAGIGMIVGIAKAYSETTPTLDTAKIQNQAQTSYIYDCNGELITEYRGTENRVMATSDEIPDNLKNAFVAIEDVRFYQHNGIDFKRIIGAFVSNLTSDSVSGGSTITQQLIKQRILSSERSYKRKIQEAYLATELESEYSKDEILVAYLNTIALGGSNYGVKAAALDYFGKNDLNDLTLRECATLAGLTQNPYYYNPRRTYYVIKKPEITNKRTNTVLTSMYNTNKITKEEYETAMNEQLVVNENSTNSTASMYPMPHFVEYAITDVITNLLESRGLDSSDSTLRNQVENEIRTNGYHIYTTVDTQVQTDLQNTLANWKNYPRTNKSNVNAEAAAVIIDYHTGEIKALVGSRNIPTQKKTFNRAYQGNMSVGSSIKPLAVYGPALDQGASPGSTVLNVPSPINGWSSSKGYPDNYEGSGFTGVVTLRTALVKSLNVPAARTLLQYSSIDASAEYLEKLGVDPSNIQKTAAGLALGTSPITPIEMAAAFGAIGNSGLYLEPLAFTKVTDVQGNVILDAANIRKSTQAFKGSTAYMLLDMMTNAVQSGTGTAAKIPGITTAGKTGTVQDYKGVYFTGITPYYSASVWLGTDDYRIGLRRGSTGGGYAAPLWKAFMTKALAGKSDKAIISDSPSSLGLVKVTTCSVSGKLATEACKADQAHPPVTEWWLKGTEPTEECDLHVSVNICSDSGKLATEYCPAQSVTKKSYILYKPGSLLADAPMSLIKKYLPNIISSISDAQESEYCDIHTSDWSSQYTNTVSNANSAVSDATTYLNNNGSKMTSAQKTSLTNDINNVKSLLSASPIDYTALQQSTNSLKDTLSTIKAALQKPSPSPSATATSTPPSTTTP